METIYVVFEICGVIFCCLCLISLVAYCTKMFHGFCLIKNIIFIKIDTHLRFRFIIVKKLKSIYILRAIYISTMVDGIRFIVVMFIGLFKNAILHSISEIVIKILLGQ